MALRDSVRRVANATAKQHVVSRQGVGAASTPQFWNATYQGAETFDANCSHIQIAGADIRGVPRLASAWSVAPAVGANLLVAQMGSSFVILAPILGRPILSPLLGAGG